MASRAASLAVNRRQMSSLSLGKMLAYPRILAHSYALCFPPSEAREIFWGVGKFSQCVRVCDLSSKRTGSRVPVLVDQEHQVESRTRKSPPVFRGGLWWVGGLGLAAWRRFWRFAVAVGDSDEERHGDDNQRGDKSEYEVIYF
jgi:hypothetical protein